MADTDGWSPTTPSACPIARSIEVVGDRWTLLVVRELMVGNCRFDGLHAQTLASPQMLAGRLKRLEADGMVERRSYSDRPRRFEYHLTDKGRALAPVMLALRDWGDTWCREPAEEVAVRTIHRGCGHEVGLGPVCQWCGAPFTAGDVSLEFGQAYAQERADKIAAARRGARERRARRRTD